MTPAKAFGARIRYYRTGKGFGIEEIANSCYMTIATLHALENGEFSPNLQMMMDLSKALNISLTCIISWMECDIDGAKNTGRERPLHIKDFGYED